MLSKLIPGLAVLVLAGCASMTEARTLADVSVIDRTTGQTLPIYRHRGQLWIEGQVGHRYSVGLHNRTGGRVLTVLSVDGVNAVSGETAATSQRGYVLSPGSSAVITGWRKSEAEVAAFYFTALPDSYAARTDRPGNTGVIGVAVFREHSPLPPIPPLPATSAPETPMDLGKAKESGTAADAQSPQSEGERTEARTTASPSVQPALKREDKIGTGHGERMHSPSYRTEFQRASNSPDELIAIRYDTRANLVRYGVLPREPRYGWAAPRPFPGDGYVPDPR